MILFKQAYSNASYSVVKTYTDENTVLNVSQKEDIGASISMKVDLLFLPSKEFLSPDF
jgi:hypothetical protein